MDNGYAPAATPTGQMESTLEFDLLAPAPFTDSEIEQLYRQDTPNDSRRLYIEELYE